MSEEIKVEAPLTDAQQVAVDKVTEQVTKAQETDFLEEVIKNNKSEFTHLGVKYRVGKLNYEQKQEIYKERVKKFTQLLRDKDYSLEKDLKREYLARGIDIDALTNKIKTLEGQKDSAKLKLGELLKNNASDSDCDKIKKEIEGILEEQKNTAMEKQTLLEFSIENQVIVHMYNYMTYLMAERFDGENWVRAFKTFKDFSQSQDDELIGKLAFLVTLIGQDTVKNKNYFWEVPWVCII